MLLRDHRYVEGARVFATTLTKRCTNCIPPPRDSTRTVLCYS